LGVRIVSTNSKIKWCANEANTKFGGGNKIKFSHKNIGSRISEPMLPDYLSLGLTFDF